MCSNRRRKPDGNRRDAGGRNRADQGEAAWRGLAARTPLRVDARSQGLPAPRPALAARAHERNGPLLLGKAVGELGGRGDLGLELGATLGRERPVRERRQLGDLLIAGFVVSTASHRHGSTNGNPGSAPRGRGRIRAEDPHALKDTVRRSLFPRTPKWCAAGIAAAARCL